MAMSKEHEKALVHNRVQLVKNLIINEDLLSYMMAEKSILTDHMKEEIQVMPPNIHLLKSCFERSVLPSFSFVRNPCYSAYQNVVIFILHQ